MITLYKLLAKVVDNVNEVCNHSITTIEVEAAAAAIDDYLGQVWDTLLDGKDDPWRVILDSFYRSYEDEPDHAVTFIAYIILTQCMLNEKLRERKLDAIRSEP